MRFIQQALNFFSSSSDSKKNNFELLLLKDIAESISNSSNVWNSAAARLAIEHEKNPGSKRNVICLAFSGGNDVSNDAPVMSNSEWNKLALAQLRKTQLRYRGRLRKARKKPST